MSTLAFAIFFFTSFLLSATSLAQSKLLCYRTDQSIAADDVPCYVVNGSQHTTCCGSAQFCMSNGLCYNSKAESALNGYIDGYFRGTCTDYTFKAPECVQCLAKDDGLMYQCGDAVNWCCFTAQNEGTCNCTSGIGVLELGVPGSIVRGSKPSPTATIYEPLTTSSSTLLPSSSASSSPLSHERGKTPGGGMIAGIVIGGTILLLITCSLTLWCWRKHKKARNFASRELSSFSGNEMVELGPANGIGIVALSAPTSPVVDILLVHGLTGKREGTWTHENGTCWPKDLLNKDIPIANIMAFGYDADVTSVFRMASSSGLRDYGKSLARDLANIRASNNGSRRPIIFVAHSLGGLVVEQALLICRNSEDAQLNNVLDSTLGIAFMGTPHGGSGLADWASVLTNFVSIINHTNRKIVKALRPSSETLAAVEEEFQQMLLRRNTRRIEIFCFYEAKPLRGIGMIVPSESAILRQYENVSISADHINMTKFPHSADAGYRNVLGILRSWVTMIDFSLESPLQSQAETNPSLRAGDSRTSLAESLPILSRQE